ncbi:MAG TPA: polyprenyl synthetase family protein [Opitutaceae bacterium]|nr:polyprenyl synthetase family protein [Opitutaceae bacterium]
MVSLERNRPATLADSLANTLRAHAPAEPGTPESLAAVVHNAVGNTGSLKRASITFLTGKSLGVPAAATEKIACAVEYFHVASLLLDDLPCMDDASVRRGLPCVHRSHGAAATILGALALINKAYALVWSATGSLSPTRAGAVSRCVDSCLGPRGVIGGQALDLDFVGTSRTARDVGRAAVGKTTPLLRLALELPAIAGLASAAEIAALRRLSTYWGLLYQCADDFADVGLADAPTGKSGGRDNALGRPNIVMRSGPERARSRMSRWAAQAAATIERLTCMNPAWGFLRPVHAAMPAPRHAVAASDVLPVAAA